MTKFIKFFVIPVLVLACGIMLTACLGDDNNKPSELDLFWERHSGHPMMSYTTADCTLDGAQWTRCLQCQEEAFIGPSPALGHSLSWQVREDPTLFEYGLREEVCTRSGCYHLNAQQPIEKIPYEVIEISIPSPVVTVTSSVGATQWLKIEIDELSLLSFTLNIESGNLRATMYTEAHMRNVYPFGDPIFMITDTRTELIEPDTYFICLYTLEGEATGSITVSHDIPEIFADGQNYTTTGHSTGESMWYKLVLDKPTRLFIVSATGEFPFVTTHHVQIINPDDFTPIWWIQQVSSGTLYRFLPAGEYLLRVHAPGLNSYHPTLSIRLTDIDDCDDIVLDEQKDVTVDRFGVWFRFTLTEQKTLRIQPFAPISAYYTEDLQEIGLPSNQVILDAGTYYFWIFNPYLTASRDFDILITEW